MSLKNNEERDHAYSKSVGFEDKQTHKIVLTMNRTWLVYEDNEADEIEQQHVDVVLTYFYEELKMLEEWIAKPNICEDYIKVVEFICEDMKEDRNKNISTDEMEGNNFTTEQENGKQRIVMESNNKVEG